METSASNPPETPRTHEEFVLSLQHLEERRDRVAQMIAERGGDPLESPHFNFLLGKIQVTQEQVIAGTVEQAMKAIESKPNIDN